jgi:hypothetical protein
MSEEPTFIPVSLARFCYNCETIFTKSLTCPVCNSAAWVWLSKWLKRLEEAC